jgi:O-antigen/teichoic acid export membrane protein
MIVLARLISPEGYGIVAMVSAVTAFAMLFQDLGISAAAIQARELTHRQVSTLFWLNVAVGTFLTLAVAASAPLVVWFYDEPAVFGATIATSFIFVIGSLGNQHSVLLRRAMRFKAVTLARIVSAVTTAVVSIGFAMAGYGYWSLILGSLLATAASTTMLWVGSGWVPGWPSRHAGIRRLVRFGANVTGFQVVNYFPQNLDNILIGRVWGSVVLGLYSRAYTLLLMPIVNIEQPLATVAMPALSRLQHNREQYRRYYKRFLSIVAVATMPLVAFMYVCSDAVVHLLLGPRWAETSAIFSILAFTAFMRPVASTRGLVMLSSGNDARFLRWGIINAAATTAGISIGVLWGARGVAVALAIVSYSLLVPSLYYCFQETPIRPRDFAQAVARPAMSSIVAGVVTAWFRESAFAPAQPVALLGAAALVFMACALLTFVAIPGGAAQLHQYFELRHYLLRPREASATAAAQ